MSDQFVAEIRMFGFNFPPTGWAFCNGQLMPISQNTALFSLLGTYYGGDGKSTFALPDLSGSVPVHAGQGPGLSERFLGEQSGTPSVTLLQSEMPVHNHNMQALNSNADSADPNTRVLGKGRYSTGTQSGAVAFYNTVSAFVQMDPQAINIAGGSLPHNNMMPYLAVNFCIAMQGIFPPRP
jgi:microcystin-dependent protein